MKRYGFAVIVAAVLLAGLGVPAQAADDWKSDWRSDWKFEITPYFWAFGVDGDVEVDGQTIDFERDFTDMDNIDFSGGILFVGQYKRFVGFVQGDYLRASVDEFDNPFARANIDEVTLDWSFLTVAAGYQFPTFTGSWIDVMVGGRFAFMNVEVDSRVGPDLERDKTLSDAILVLRPNFRLTDKLRFNPTLSVGTGDSDIVYELQPQLQYNFTETFGVRFGYRKIHYEVETDRGNDVEVDFDGPILGVSFKF